MDQNIKNSKINDLTVLNIELNNYANKKKKIKRINAISGKVWKYFGKFEEKKTNKKL